MGATDRDRRNSRREKGRPDEGGTDQLFQEQRRTRGRGRGFGSTGARTRPAQGRRPAFGCLMHLSVIEQTMPRVKLDARCRASMEAFR